MKDWPRDQLRELLSDDNPHVRRAAFGELFERADLRARELTARLFSDEVLAALCVSVKHPVTILRVALTQSTWFRASQAWGQAPRSEAGRQIFNLSTLRKTLELVAVPAGDFTDLWGMNLEVRDAQTFLVRLRQKARSGENWLTEVEGGMSNLLVSPQGRCVLKWGDPPEEIEVTFCHAESEK